MKTFYNLGPGDNVIVTLEVLVESFMIQSAALLWNILCCQDFFFYCIRAHITEGTKHDDAPFSGNMTIYNVESMALQRHDVASTLMRRCINVMCPLCSDR